MTGAADGIAQILERLSALKPDEPAIIAGDHITTWKSFNGRAEGLARCFQAAGLDHQSKVAVYLRNGPHYLETVFAAFKAGMIPVNVNYRYGVTELVYLFENADIEAVVFDSSFDACVVELCEQLAGIRLWCRVGMTDGGDAIPYEEAVRYHGPTEAFERDIDDLVIIYTGGTTGLPKGVMWRQTDIVPLLAGKQDVTVSGVGSELGDGRSTQLADFDHICLIACPLMHGTGLFMALAALLGGGTVVTLTGATFDADELCHAVATNRVTSVVLVGDAFARPILRSLNAAADAHDISSIRSIVSSGAMWSHEVKAGLLEHNRAMILVDSFGASEISGLGRSVSTAETIKGTGFFEISEYAHLVDEGGLLIGPDSTEPGLVVVGGPLPIGYYKDPEKTAATFLVIGGTRYARTGDWARYTDDGSLVFLGRGSGCINSGGEKIFPEEVEEIIKRHRGIVDAAVLGIPDEQFGQRVVALVQPDHSVPLSEVEVRDHVRSHLAGFKVPRQLWFVPSLERTPSGKLDFERLRAMVDTFQRGDAPASPSNHGGADKTISGSSIPEDDPDGPAAA
jgi:fatty-acyl-CoA synthase